MPHVYRNYNYAPRLKLVCALYARDPTAMPAPDPLSEKIQNFLIPDFLREDNSLLDYMETGEFFFSPIMLCDWLYSHGMWDWPHTHEELVTIGLSRRTVDWLVGPATASDDQCKAVVAFVEWMSWPEVADALGASGQVRDLASEIQVRMDASINLRDAYVPLAICREMMDRLREMTRDRWPIPD